jgi:hypothetical protein
MLHFSRLMNTAFPVGVMFVIQLRAETPLHCDTTVTPPQHHCNITIETTVTPLQHHCDITITQVSCLSYNYGQKHSIELDKAKATIKYLVHVSVSMSVYVCVCVCVCVCVSLCRKHSIELDKATFNRHISGTNLTPR